MTAFITRFAPSPTGQLHLGHAYSALTVFQAAREAGGRFLLRIEDIDTIRCKPEFERDIFEDLAWLGLDWEEPVLRQSEHFADYQSALDTLIENQLVYRCFKTRREIMEDIARAPHHPGEGPEGVIYTGPTEPLSADEEAERLARGDPFAWRLSLAAVRDHLGAEFSNLTFEETGQSPGGQTGICAIQPELLGDVILARKDIGTSYHIAVVVDDARQGITHVIRGQDLFFAVSIHRLLQELLRLPTPTYFHHGLINNEAGERLTKRDLAAALGDMRTNSVSPEQIRRDLGFNW